MSNSHSENKPAKNQEETPYDWAKNAEQAAIKAEEEINKIKKEAQNQFKSNKVE